MAMRQALAMAMHMTTSDADLVGRLRENGVALANEETMSAAIHDVYCGIAADHDHPNDKDRAQARDMLAAMQRHSGY